MKPPPLRKSPGTGRQVIPVKLVNISSCWVLQGTQRIAPTTQASITKKCSFQGGRQKVLGYNTADGFILWWWLQLPWLNCFPHCLSARVPEIIRGSKLPGSEGCTEIFRLHVREASLLPSVLPAASSMCIQCGSAGSSGVLWLLGAWAALLLCSYNLSTWGPLNRKGSLDNHSGASQMTSPSTSSKRKGLT